MNSYVIVVWGIMCFLSFLIFYNHKQISFNLLLPYLLLSMGALFSIRSHITPFIAHFSILLPVLSFFLLPKDKLFLLLRTLEKIFFILITISFFLYLLDKLEILPIVNKTILRQYEFNNYLLYLNVKGYNGAFCGFSLEPGYISLLLVSLLTINEYDFSIRRNWIYLASLLCSLSLGGYILGFISFILFKTINQKSVSKSFMVLIGIIIVFAGIVLFAFSYNNGDNIIAEKILNRLMFDEELGIVGNNRENAIAREIYDSYFYSDKIWLGIGLEAFEKARNINGINACSWREFVIVYGAFYTFIYFVASLYLFSKTYMKKTLPFYVVFWLDFIQHGDLYSETLYLAIIVMLINMKKKLAHNKNIVTCSIKM